MSYCTADDVRLIIETDLSDANITEIIVLSDADLDRRLGGSTLDDDLKKKCSMYISAITIANRKPKKYTAGNVSIDMGSQIEKWEAEVASIIKDVTAGRARVKSSVYQAIDEDDRYSVT